MEYNEDVLVIPWVLALLGDNPMQSEFACHIGMRGKQYCRVCKVVGKTREQAVEEDEGDEGNESDDSEDGKKRRKFVESVDQIKQRIRAFIKVHPRYSHSGYTSDTLLGRRNSHQEPNPGCVGQYVRRGQKRRIGDRYQKDADREWRQRHIPGPVPTEDLEFP